jgi:hypothetical protein
MTKILNLVEKTNKSQTYEELLLEHLESLDEESRQNIPRNMVVCFDIDDSRSNSGFTILAGETASEMVGCLEVVKTLIIMGSFGAIS